ncbi:hypothetical protein Sme01_64730 [Sphaerisporangium melleum]|uniref:Uncharacterized protein n=1 Tax=Sphaerisporangium melleum TaxID=321316 RepID=A0A917VQD4_9ACTN|nr:hypothetical protein GCM10007964_52580 [Sphaerisporangium melleum]GII73997.1 hypothetical protein Sme01_64730 [Sphaerisporangium melleum]
MVSAASGLLGQTSSLLGHMTCLLRQLVMIVGWLVLLVGSVRLLLDPPSSLAPEHFLTPGAGAAAVVQGLVRMPPQWWRTRRPRLDADRLPAPGPHSGHDREIPRNRASGPGR